METQVPKAIVEVAEEITPTPTGEPEKPGTIACPGCRLLDPARINTFNRDGTLKKPKPRRPRQKPEDTTPRPKRRRKKKGEPRQATFQDWLIAKKRHKP